MNLHSVTKGTGTPVTFVHGFTQTSRSWEPVLAQMHTPIAAQLIDAPGHGDSGDGKRTLSDIGNDLVDTMHQGTLVGYSMGARMALHAALIRSPKIEALCLISGTAGLDDEEDRHSRRKHDNALADRIETIGVQLFLDEWLSQPLFSGLSPESAQIEDRRRNTAQGLADSLRFAGTGTQQPLWARLSEVDIPVLLIAGERDEKFVQLAQRMSTSFPRCEVRIASNTGHTVHLEDPEQFVHIFETWLLQRK